MKVKKRHFVESIEVEDVLLTVEKYGETGEVTRVFIGEIEVTGLLDKVKDDPDFFESLETKHEFDEDAAYELSRE